MIYFHTREIIVGKIHGRKAFTKLHQQSLMLHAKCGNAIMYVDLILANLTQTHVWQQKIMCWKLSDRQKIKRVNLLYL